MNQLSIKHQQAAASILNVLTNSIPIVGPALSEGLYNYWNNVKQERLNIFVEKFKDYLEKNNNDEINPEFLRTEDFAQFFELVLRKVTETKSHKKLEVFKDILINNIKAREINDFADTFLNLISQLHEKQIELLKDLHNNEKHFSEKKELGDNTNYEFKSLYKEMYEVYAQDLIAKGLIDVHNTSGPMKMQTMLLSVYGKQFLQFISNSR